jgi:iron complex transport system permease protein
MLNKKNIFVYVVMSTLISIVFLFSLVSGLNDMSLTGVVKAIFDNADESTIMIIKHIRFPRIIMTCITGSALAVSGCVFQAILKNPLADPFTLGISGGAAFGSAIAFISGLASKTCFFIPLFAFIGTILSVSIVYLLSTCKKFDPNAMVLSGVVVSYVFSSAIMLMFTLSTSNSVHMAFIWLMGNFSIFDKSMILFITTITLTGIIILSLSGNIINAISLSSEKSRTFGINVERNINFLFLTASFITAVTVSVCGIIGFIGLMVPHIMRRIVGTNNLLLIPISAFAGAIFLLLCDTFSRILFAPISIPIGVTTSIIGGSFFVWSLLKSKRNIQ